MPRHSPATACATPSAPASSSSPPPPAPVSCESRYETTLSTRADLTEELRARRKELGRNLKTARQTAGLLQRELAHKIGYSRSAVGNAETGRCGYAHRFWELCDEVLETEGTLSRSYNEIRRRRIRHVIESDHAPMVSDTSHVPVPEDFRITVIIRCTKNAWYIESASAEGLVTP
jgi:DNA-binding XRE family transcriptional regulator